MKVEHLGKNIYHVIIEDRNERAEAFIRMQEYYESSYPEIQGKIFTLGYVKSLGGPNSKCNTYCGTKHTISAWVGYNFPGHVLDPFIKGLFDPLTEYERSFLEIFRYKTDPFYIIGTDGKSPDTLQHEIMHGLYTVDAAYCSKVRKELHKAYAKYPKETKGFKEALAKKGYAQSVLDDEFQAYVGADLDYTIEKIYDISVFKELSKKLNDIYSEHKP